MSPFIAPKSGRGPVQKKLVQEGQDILRSVGIDPIFGKEMFVWAELHAEGIHALPALEEVVEGLRDVNLRNGGYDEMVEELTRLGRIAADL